MSAGTFIDLRQHWCGRLGTATIYFDRHAGGVLRVARAPAEVPEPAPRGASPEHLLRCGLRLQLECRQRPGSADHGRSVVARQEHDPAPRFHFLEEGPVRLGMRVAFDLLDDEGHYLGDGRQDVWLYPEGDVHVTWAVQSIDLAGHGPVRAAWVDVAADAGYQDLRLGARQVSGDDALRLGFGDDLPERSVRLDGDGLPPLGLSWARDRGDVLQVGYDHGALPPFYASRWPTGMQQWARGNMGWQTTDSAGVTAACGQDGATLRFAWIEAGTDTADVTHAATLVLSVADDDADRERRLAALQAPLTPEVAGGDFRCWTEEDGTYEVGQGDPSGARITFPADPLERIVRLRHYRRKTDPRHRGGVTARVDGTPVPAQLMSEGELTDDVCVVMEMSHRNDSMDDVIVAARLRADAPTTIDIDKGRGLHAAYQSEGTGVDLQRRAGNRRDLVVWSHRNPARPLLELDLFSGAVHRWTGHAPQAEPVVWELPMAWFLSCGISRHHYCNQIDRFEILDNGPDRVQVFFSGTNPNRRARSETWLTIPDHPRPRIEARMRMTVLQQWDGANVEFSDIFPYPSRLPETWFHDAVLFLQGDGSSLVYTQRPDRSTHRRPTGDPGPHLFYGLFASDRGNVLAFMENAQHPEVPFHYSVCGNYIDIHVNLQPARVPVPAGTVFEVRATYELYGDGGTSLDEVRDIGRRSLAAGALTV